MIIMKLSRNPKPTNGTALWTETATKLTSIILIKLGWKYTHGLLEVPMIYFHLSIYKEPRQTSTKGNTVINIIITLIPRLL